MTTRCDMQISWLLKMNVVVYGCMNLSLTNIVHFCSNKHLPGTNHDSLLGKCILVSVEEFTGP